jgi:DNA-binding XRE family transcriptional regulator
LIYFARIGRDGPVKIGHSTAITHRMRQLEGEFGQPPTLLASADGGRLEEIQLHRQFGEFRIGESELFRPEPSLLEYIDGLTNALPDDDSAAWIGGFGDIEIFEGAMISALEAERRLSECQARIPGILRSLRAEMGLTLREMGEQLGVSFTYVSKIENSKLAAGLPFLRSLYDVWKARKKSKPKGKGD